MKRNLEIHRNFLYKETNLGSWVILGFRGRENEVFPLLI
jgi:hypothetical protein